MILSAVGRYTSCTLCSTALFAIALICQPAPASAGELPALKEGLWEFHRTIDDETTTSQQCVDPTDLLTRQKADLERALCRVTPVERSGESYRYTSECSMSRIESRTTLVLTARGEDAYQIRTEGTLNGRPFTELLMAKRLGPCKQ